jgi:tetratricopeptide (TPR) repeat protein
MKKIVVLSLSAFILAGCNNSTQPTANTNSAVQNTNGTTISSQKSDSSLVVSSHSTTKPEQTAPSSNSSSMSSPNQQAIDVSEMTAKIEKAEKEFKAKPTDTKAKDSLATVYFERAFALTKAAQYRAALGDFRKGLKLKPDDKEAKDMHDQIISIFESIGRQPPKEGEEPPPLPYKKES